MRLSRAASVGIFVVAAGQSSASFAVDICAETVPANRFIDGFPAYAQCAGASGSAIYSNNGIDTSTTNGGTGWVRTQGSGGYQCTELAHRYLHFKWNVTSVPNGNAGVWCDGTIPSGLVKVTAPVHGDLIVLAPGSCGADGTTGHVAVVDVVNADSTLMAIQQNVASRGRYNFTCAACFLHVAANNGALPDAGAPIDASSSGGSTVVVGSGGAAGPTATGGAPGSTATGGAPGSTGTAGAPGPLASGGATGTTGIGPGAPSNDVGAGCACALVDGSGGDAGLGLVTLLGLMAATAGRRRRRALALVSGSSGRR